MALSFEIDDDLSDRIEALASQRVLSPASIMRDAIAEYVAREEARESFRRDALASWSAYQESGLHLTDQEVEAWLDTWGTDAEAGMPRCHE